MKHHNKRSLFSTAHHPTPKIIETTQDSDKQTIKGCRWIIGSLDDPNWSYCQRPRLPRRSYCAEHHDRSIDPDGDPLFADEGAELALQIPDPPLADDDGELPWPIVGVALDE